MCTNAKSDAKADRVFSGRSYCDILSFDPLCLFQEISDLDHSKDVGKWPHLVSRTMTILATVTDPAIYLFFSDPFREYLSKLLSCCRTPRNQQQSLSVLNGVDQPHGQAYSMSMFSLRTKRRIEPVHDSIRTSCKPAMTDNTTENVF